MFWTFSFSYLTVKGIYNSWKFGGLIDGFNNSRRKISSRVKEQQMIQYVPYTFVPPLKNILKHNSYIFRNPESLGTDINNVACSRLGNMLYVDTQKGKEAMNT